MVLPQRLSVGHCEQGDAHLRKEGRAVSLGQQTFTVGSAGWRPTFLQWL